MAYNMLSEIHKDSHRWTICVLVSRMWNYRGGTDEGPIKHTDLVLLDCEGNHMYGQIPSTAVDRLKDVLQEGKVFVIKKFLCNPSRPSFRAVESPFMVQFTRYTVVEEMPGMEDNFPFCTYSLTAFADIPKPSQTPARFIDVIGRVSMVSDLIPVQSMYQTTTSNTRTIILTDLLGHELRLVLWGDRATEFDAETVRAMGAKEPVIAIFVGTLPKTSRGVRGLSGSSACRWYIDEDIPDINSFRASLGEHFTPLAEFVPTGPDALRSRVQEDPVFKTVEELKALDPFVHMDMRFFCTVTVSRLGSNQRWWFPSCSTCRKSANYTSYGNQYKCSDDACTSVEADLTYCVSVFATDGIKEAEFVFFDKVAAGVVGKPLVAILRQRYPGCVTMEDLANAARHDDFVPVEVTRLVGQKYRLMVCISKKWKIKSNEDLSFQINRVEETYKPELPPSVFDIASGSGGSSSSGSGVCVQLPVLGPVFSSAGAYPGQLPRVARGSPAGQAHTPAPPAARLGPLTPAARSSAPKRGARRSLFTSPAKDKTQVPADEAPSSNQPAVEPVIEDAADVIPPKDDGSVLPKSKRGVTAAKSASTAKKQRQ